MHQIYLMERILQELHSQSFATLGKLKTVDNLQVSFEFKYMSVLNFSHGLVGKSGGISGNLE